MALQQTRSTVPSLTAENELISWGRRIIEGEELRIRKGASPITNPTIAVVKVRFENFFETYNNHKALAKKTLAYSESAIEMRREADEIILQIWNNVEATHSSLPDDVRKKECEEYGLIYFYRKNELTKPVIPELRIIALPETFV